MYEQPALYIDGRFLSGQGRTSSLVLNPATAEVLAELPHATSTDLDEAVTAATRVFPKWRATPSLERAAILHGAASLLRERVEAIAETLTLEQGKVLAEARGEVLVSADIFDWSAEEARRSYGRIVPARIPHTRQAVVLEPVGPCALFTPWNFPALTPARKISAALAAGCTAVIKAAEETPGTATAIVRALHDAGLPAGAINLVFGVPSEISRYLIDQPAIRKVSFTGSTPVGKALLAQAAQTVKRTTMELGGNAPVIVCADADIEAAAQACAASKFRNAGQVCIAPSRFLVQDTVYDRFIDTFSQHAAALVIGSGIDGTSQMGPLANGRRMDQMEEICADAIDQGGRVVTGGCRIGNSGNFFAPTVVDDPSLESRLFTQETFGPIAPFKRFGSLDEALTMANSVEAGLAAYAFTRSLNSARVLSEELEAGMVGLNGFAVSTPETPFGGIKQSGHGQEGGSEGLLAYLNVKLVVEC